MLLLRWWLTALACAATAGPSICRGEEEGITSPVRSIFCLCNTFKIARLPSNPKRTTVRGGKASNFEGGIRVNGFVSGGCLPKSRRGIKLDGLVTGWDWCKNSSPSLPASRV